MSNTPRDDDDRKHRGPSHPHDRHAERLEKEKRRELERTGFTPADALRQDLKLRPIIDQILNNDPNTKSNGPQR